MHVHSAACDTGLLHQGVGFQAHCLHPACNGGCGQRDLARCQTPSPLLTGRTRGRDTDARLKYTVAVYGDKLRGLLVAWPVS